MNMNSSSATDNDRLPRKVSPPSERGKAPHDIIGGSNHRNRKDHKKRLNHHHSSISNSGNQNPSHKRQKFRHEAMDLDPLFPKLDQRDPVHARRIQQRRRAVAIGKNTPGYAEYCKQVPKEKRKPCSMETPPTPDHTLDIPTKRWQGLVNAWRRALHRYDPPDLVSSFNDTATGDSAATTATTRAPTKDAKGNSNHVQLREIEEAIAKGLLVDVSTPIKSTPDAMDKDVDDDIVGSPVSVLSEESRHHDVIMDFGNYNDVDLLDGVDSDDDLL